MSNRGIRGRGDTYNLREDYSSVAFGRAIEMDPLTVFPPEIIHQIWRHLEPPDLLAARAVAPHWLTSVSNCPGAWVTDFSHDWTEFLAVKKAVRSWSSKKIRRQTVQNVRGCLFTESAYYILYGNGELRMFSPNGKPVREFDCSATDLHQGHRCLLIGVDDVNVSERSQFHHRTIISDFALNHIESFDGQITAASPNGCSFVQGGQTFFSVGPEFPPTHQIPISFDAQLTFLPSCVVSIQGFTVKTVQLFDPITESFADLKTLTSSPRWIPSVEILPGPEDFFSVMVEQRDFNTVSVYHKDTPLYEDCYPSSFKSLFTKDYFLLSLQDTATVFSLKDFTKRYNLELPIHFNIKNIKCEPWSLVDNSIVVFNLNSCTLSDPMHWMVYQLSPMPSRLPPSGVNEHFKPKLKLLSTNSTPEIRINGGLSVSEFEIYPYYGFKIQTQSSHSSGNERIVYLLYFEI